MPVTRSGRGQQVVHAVLVNRYSIISTKNKKLNGRNHLSAESSLVGDNRLGRLILCCGEAWLSGLVAILAILPNLNRFVECASRP